MSRPDVDESGALLGGDPPPRLFAATPEPAQQRRSYDVGAHTWQSWPPAARADSGSFAQPVDGTGDGENGAGGDMPVIRQRCTVAAVTAVVFLCIYLAWPFRAGEEGGEVHGSVNTRATLGGVPGSLVGGSVAIIGGGLAGAVTALELASRGVGGITLFEQSPSLLASTSSMISATINLDTVYRDWLHGKEIFSVYTAVEMGYSEYSAVGASNDTRWSAFLGNAASRLSSDPRTFKTQRRAFFRKSYESLVALVRAYPSLCSAIIGHWCCEAGPMTHNYLAGAGAACGNDTMGLFQVTGDPKLCAWMKTGAGAAALGCDDASLRSRGDCEAAGHVWRDVQYTFYDRAETYARIGGFLQEDTAIECSIVEHKITGFARSEILFQVVGDLLREKGVRVALSCDVLGVEPVPQDLSARLLLRVGAGAGGRPCALEAPQGLVYDHVVVAAAAASVPLLATLDPTLRDHLVGIKGYGLMGGAGSPTVPPTEAAYGLHLLDESRQFRAAYVRSTSDMHVKAWGGHDVQASNSGMKPPYAFCDAATEAHIFKNGPSCARALDAAAGTVRLAGMRPVSSLAGVPLLKRYVGPYRNLLLNTGYGYNGYDLAWFASSCMAQWLVADSLEDPVCEAAVATGPEPW
eukprot:TRINITY_DN24987_c0_g1_i1.p1 TRINITY_DN24987_c0_g1~~TRINITY_DN24987_c0_g1_i1.p1  ORF type:complete len:634 (-),score=113.70 TRINITY_DN24987_c0_g1_i1:93-1994(-)